MLAIFDIDGTLCDTQDAEGNCFAQACFDLEARFKLELFRTDDTSVHFRDYRNPDKMFHLLEKFRRTRSLSHKPI